MYNSIGGPAGGGALVGGGAMLPATGGSDWLIWVAGFLVVMGGALLIGNRQARRAQN